MDTGLPTGIQYVELDGRIFYLKSVRDVSLLVGFSSLYYTALTSKRDEIGVD